jgi:hypothetical protein
MKRRRLKPKLQIKVMMTCHHDGFGGLNLFRAFGLVAFLAGLIGENLGSRSPRRLRSYEQR